MKKFLLFVISLFVTCSVLANPVAGYYEEFPEPILSGRDILICLLITVIVETFILWCFKYRGWIKLFHIIFINLLSNFFVNLYYSDIVMDRVNSLMVLLMLELGAILFEFIEIGVAYRHTKKLFGVITLANLISFFTGMVIYALFV